MKKIATVSTFLIALLLCVSPVMSQNCKKLVKVKKDPMSDEKTLASNSWILSNGLQMGFVRKGAKFSIEVVVRLNGDQHFKISKGDSIGLKLNNGKITYFYANRDYAPVKSVSGTNIQSAYVYFCDATKQDFEEIAKNGVAVVQAKMPQFDKTSEVNTKYSARFAAIASCLLTEQ